MESSWKDLGQYNTFRAAMNHVHLTFEFWFVQSVIPCSGMCWTFSRISSCSRRWVSSHDIVARRIYPTFQLPTCEEWFGVVEKLHGLLWADPPEGRTPTLLSTMKSLLDIDIKFSERLVTLTFKLETLIIIYFLICQSTLT